MPKDMWKTGINEIEANFSKSMRFKSDPALVAEQNRDKL